MNKNHYSQIYETKNTKFFGKLANGTDVFLYTLRNSNNLECCISTYGATITSLKIPTANKTVDVVLGFETLDDYVNSFQLPSAPFLGTIVGRFAGRINDGLFVLNNKNIQLTKNWKSHQIHGGIEGFSKKVWQVISFSEEKNPSITLAYTSPDREENFPGELTVQVTYTLTEKNEIKVSFSAKSTEDTLVNLTQHSYFNLDGHENDITGQKLTVHSQKILETTDELIPTGNYISLENHAFDFSRAKNCPVTIDTTFALDGKEAATLYSEKNQLKMTVTTNQPGVHVYVGGNCFGQIKGKEEAEYHPLSGICFETQNFPDAPNHSHFPSAVLKKEEEYLHQTIFKFENL